MVFTTQEKIRKKIKKYNSELKKYKNKLSEYKKKLPELERYSDDLKRLIPEFKVSNNLYIRIESIYTESRVLEQALSAKNLILDTRIMEITYQMDRKICSVSTFIQEYNIKEIPKDIAWEIGITIDNAINNIDIMQ